MTERTVLARVQTLYATAAVLAAENPTLKEGEFGTESDTYRQKIGDGSTAWNALPYLMHPRGMAVIDPQVNDQFTMMRAENAITIREGTAVMRGTGSVTFELRYAADRSTAGTLAIVAETVSNTTTGQALTIQNQPVPADAYLWLAITGVTGSVSELNVTLSF